MKLIFIFFLNLLFIFLLFTNESIAHSLVNNNSGFGDKALVANTTGSENNAFGSNALGSNTTGASNVAMGSGALFANTTGADNTAVGLNALDANTTASYNTAVGRDAGGKIRPIFTYGINSSTCRDFQVLLYIDKKARSKTFTACKFNWGYWSFNYWDWPGAEKYIN